MLNEVMNTNLEDGEPRTNNVPFPSFRPYPLTWDNRRPTTEAAVAKKHDASSYRRIHTFPFGMYDVTSYC